jgi:membrane fusion protein, heavy metal efflux system
LSDSPPVSRRRPLPFAVQVGLVAVAAVVLVLALVVLPSALRAAAARPEPTPAAPPPGTFQATPEQWRALTFAPASEMDFADRVTTEGKIAQDDNATVQITPPFSGRVLSVAVQVGDVVRRGQTLLTADASEVAQARNDLQAAQTALDTAKAQAALASANAARQEALYKINGAALKDVQQASSDSAAAQNTVKADGAALVLVQQRLRVLQAAAGGGAQGVVRAPLSGVVTQRQVGPGQYLNATSNGATTPIFAVSDLSRVWLVANVPEADAARMHRGDPITVTVSGLPGRVYHARLDQVAPTLDPATRRLLVHATLENPGDELRPEMFASFALDTGPGRQSLGVPSSAVIYEGDSARVWVAGPNRSLGLRQVKTGRTQNGEVEVLSGLEPGDRVATSGAIFIDRAAQGA